MGGAFNDEMGFVQRHGVNNLNGRYGRPMRPAFLSKWVRQNMPHLELDVFTQQRDGSLDSRYLGYHWHWNFQDGSNAEIGLNTSTENIASPFTINGNRGIRVTPGHYDFGEYFVFWNTNSASRLSFNNRVGMGNFYDGYRQWTSNLRFNIIHRPLSDFFLVYNERRDDRTGDMISRAVIAKMTYMVAF